MIRLRFRVDLELHNVPYTWHCYGDIAVGKKRPFDPNREILQRKEARKIGADRYFTGNPCKYGHIAERDTRTSNCCECNRLRGLENNKKPGVKEKAKISSKKSYEKNRESVLARGKIRNESGYNKQYYQDNKESFIATVRAWQKANPEKRNTYRQNRRAAGLLQHKDVEIILEKQNYKCAICFVKLPKRGYHRDHIQPVSKSGTSHPSNIQITCDPCNRKKGNKDPFVYAKSLGRLL